VFNVADASITVGCGVLLVGVWLNERTQRKKAADMEVTSGKVEEV
jgi:lipoprotein signal peptidase